MGNGTLKGTIVKGSSGGSGGGTAATTSFAPTATITSDNVQYAIEEVDSSLSAIAQDIAAISGLGGYINSYDFGTATPTQQALTDYALTQLPNITALEVFNGTRVKNLFDNHIWILTNTPNTVPPVFEWADNGYDTVGIASTTVAGLVKGSATNGGLTIASDGTAAVTGFNTKYDKSGGVLSGDISIEKNSAETSLINLKVGTVSSILSANSSGIFLYRTYNNRLAYDNSSSKWYIYKLGVAKELGLTDASEISYSGTLSSTTVKKAIEEVDGKLLLKANLVDGKVPLTELPELGGAAADITPITATSGSVSLEANKAYKMTAQGDITITLPASETLDTDKVNKTNLHLRNEKASLAISFPVVMMFKDGKDFSAIAPGHYYICFEYNSLAERWEADIKQQKFSGATVRKVADFSSEIPAGYVVSHVAFDGAALETAANNTAELVFPLQDTPYNPAFQRMQWPYSSSYVTRYKIKMPSARKILSYTVTGWAENGSMTDRILKSFRVWAATTDVDITASNWKDNCKLIDEQINAFTTSDHNVTKKFAVSFDVNAVCIIIEPTANWYGGYVCLGQTRFFGE